MSRRRDHRTGSISRRTVVAAGLAGATIASLYPTRIGAMRIRAMGVATPGTPAAGEVPTQGDVPSELSALDEAMRDIVTRWHLPGAQLSVSSGGRLVLERAYGFADVDLAEPMQPNHRIRIASVSKTLTAVAIMALIEDGLLALDTEVFPLLGATPAPGAIVDPRLNTITVGHLLVHGGGFDSTISGDPQYLPLSQLAASVFGEAGPPSAAMIARFMMGVPLDFDPGSRSVYSNFGYNLLGRVIEVVSGQSYEDFVRARVLQPAGITEMVLGHTRLEDRADGEVRYYDPPDYPPAFPSVFPGEGFVPSAYGSFFMEAMDAHGGWIATASDLVRYALSVDGTRGPALLSPGTVERLLAAQRPPVGDSDGGLMPNPASGLGWFVRDTPLGRTWEHNGALTGSNASLLTRNDAGTTVAFIANTLPVDFPAFFTDLAESLLGTTASITDWPDVNLFPTG